MASPFPPPPQANVPAPVSGTMTPRVAPAGAGATWWADGWRLFTPRIGTWFIIMIVYMVASLLLSNVPYIGSFAQLLLTPVFQGGIMLGIDGLRRGEPLRLGHLFDGFRGPHFVRLLLVAIFNGVLCLVAVVIGVVILAAGIGLSGAMDLASLTDPWALVESAGATFALLVLLVIVVTALLAMANWFAPALIVLQDAQPLDAMLASVRTSLRNWVPFLVYGLIGLVIAIVAMCILVFTAGAIGFEIVVAVLTGSASWKSFIGAAVALGAIYFALAMVIGPVIFGSTWASYRDTLAPENS
jgi:uncharacterized membrane protein